jgi:predicted Zn-dependent protease
MAAGRYAEAAAAYSELSAAAPGNAGLLLNLGMALHLSGDSRAAAGPLTEAHRRNPASFPAAFFLGEALLRTGRAAAAVAPLRVAARLDPRHAQARSLLADALLAEGRPRDAEPQLVELTRLLPDDASAWLRLGRGYEALAGAAFESLLERGPESAFTLALVAEVRRDEARPEAALELYRKASARAPGMRGLQAEIAALERALGREQQAQEAEAAERRLPAPDCARAVLECRFAAGRHRDVLRAAGAAETLASAYWLARSANELARSAFETLQRLPPSAPLHEWRAGQLRAEGRYGEAIEEWRRALALAPGDGRLRLELAVTLRLDQQLAEAQAVLEALVSEAPDAAAARYLLGDVLLARQQPEQALVHLERAVHIDPGLAHAQASLGRVLALLGRPADAIPHLERALEVDEDGSLHLQLARAYQSVSRGADAERVLAARERLRRAGEPAASPEPPR